MTTTYCHAPIECSKVIYKLVNDFKVISKKINDCKINDCKTNNCVLLNST